MTIIQVEFASEPGAINWVVSQDIGTRVPGRVIHLMHGSSERFAEFVECRFRLGCETVEDIDMIIEFSQQLQFPIHFCICERLTQEWLEKYPTKPTDLLGYNLQNLLKFLWKKRDAEHLSQFAPRMQGSEIWDLNRQLEEYLSIVSPDSEGNIGGTYFFENVMMCGRTSVYPRDTYRSIRVTHSRYVKRAECLTLSLILDFEEPECD